MTLSLAVVDGGVVVALIIVSYVEKTGILLPNDQIFLLLQLVVLLLMQT